MALMVPLVGAPASHGSILMAPDALATALAADELIDRLSACVTTAYTRVERTMPSWFCSTSVIDSYSQLRDAYTPPFEAIFATDGMPGVVWCSLWLVESARYALACSHHCVWHALTRGLCVLSPVASAFASA